MKNVLDKIFYKNEVNIYIDNKLICTSKIVNCTSKIVNGSVQFTIPEEFTSKSGTCIVRFELI